MRDRDTIEQELEITRSDLEQTLARLKGVVRDKVDVKAKAHRALERGKHRAYEGLGRAEQTTTNLVARGFSAARRRPGTVFAGIGAVLLGLMVMASRRRAHRRAAW